MTDALIQEYVRMARREYSGMSEEEHRREAERILRVYGAAVLESQVAWLYDPSGRASPVQTVSRFRAWLAGADIKGFVL